MNRNQFTFYKSFDDTFEILNDKQALLYLNTLRDVQFLRVKIQDVSFSDVILKAIWQSTKHTLETSIKGYLDSQLSSKVTNPFFGCYVGYSKDKDPFRTPSTTPYEGGDEQVKGKGEDKGENKDKGKEEIPSIEEVKEFAKEYAMRNKKDEAQCIALAVKGYNNYTDNKWRDVNDNPIIRWKTKLQNSYLSLEKLNDAIDLEEDKFNKSMQWLCSINRMYEDVGYCKRTYESKLSSGVNDDYVPHLKNVLQYKNII